MIDRKWIGHELGKAVLPIERGRLQFFAQAIGETNPVYRDPDAARAAGYADIPAPPTFAFAANLDSGVTLKMLHELCIPIGRILHGEQSFEYLAPIVAGDEITASSRIKNIYDKRGGALEFIELETVALNQRGEAVANLSSIVVVRN